MLKNRVSRDIKQTQNNIVLVIRKEKKNKKLLQWVELRFTGGNTRVLATKILGNFLI